MTGPNDAPYTAHRLTEADDALLRRFVEHEAVVPVLSRGDLQRRLAPDRRLFAVLDDTGDAMGFVHVALTARFPASLDEVLSGPVCLGPPAHGTFYGITRTSDRVRGRAGDLLKAVAAALHAEHPGLRLATLSPLPGFRAWLEAALTARGHADASAAVEHLARRAAIETPPCEADLPLGTLARAYQAARDGRGRILDPVARFHLGNGADAHRILLGADCSWHGLSQSFGVMASYRYFPATHEARPAVDAAAALEHLLAWLPGAEAA
ncbi:MAG: malonyl-CoA decarboxylase family protein [Myxococcales bacterium]|nr:malonyl-CoA decarboxylase family protein [Myxococcales bacterium]